MTEKKLTKEERRKRALLLIEQNKRKNRNLIHVKLSDPLKKAFDEYRREHAPPGEQKLNNNAAANLIFATHPKLNKLFSEDNA